MNLSSIKNTVESIEMSDEMRKRIINNTKTAVYMDMEVKSMKTINKKRFIAFAAAAVLCICLPIGVMAMNGTGFFKDVTNISGAVTGSVYEQATNEIKVETVVANDNLIINADFVNTDMVPYSEFDVLKIAEYEIVDGKGNIIINNSSTESVAICDGNIQWTVSTTDLESGDYILNIKSFEGGKKADQPLNVSGIWKCSFSI
ncbi:MAG: hypothetical protein IKV96_01425 [Firmicutes bacterium]|nr:hypothetical protein [Bacillota bacterium]